jgi:hypothetical protein
MNRPHTYTELAAIRRAHDEEVRPVSAKKLPSVPQMLVRAHTGHFKLLRAAKERRRIPRPVFVGEARGYATARGTLLHWEAVRATDEPGVFELTDRGVALLDALDAKGWK